MKKKLIILVVFMFLLTACSKDNYLTEEFDYFYFDTPINIKIYYTKKDNYNFEDIDKGMDNILNSIQKEFDPNDKTSTLSKLNENYSLEVSDDFKMILNETIDACHISGNRYDPSSGKLIDLWSINNENHIATKEEVEDAKKYIGCEDIKIEGNKVSMPKGYKLDFGSIVKGYAADELESFLKSKEVYSSILNLGGNIQTIGLKPNEEDYKIAIMKPEIYNFTNENAMLMDIGSKAVVTSGINQRFFEKDGKIYHHIIDAIDGYPVDNGLASVTIIADEGIDADTLSTVVFIMGLEEGYKYIESLDGIEAVFITRDKKIYITDENLDYEVIADDYKVEDKKIS